MLARNGSSPCISESVKMLDRTTNVGLSEQPSPQAKSLFCSCNPPVSSDDFLRAPDFQVLENTKAPRVGLELTTLRLTVASKTKIKLTLLESLRTKLYTCNAKKHFEVCPIISTNSFDCYQ